MKKLIVGLVLVGLLVFPGISKAQVMDEAAFRLQLQAIYNQLVELLAVLQAQVLAQNGNTLPNANGVIVEQPPTLRDIAQEQADITFEEQCETPIANLDRQLAELKTKYDRDYAEIRLNNGGVFAGGLAQLVQKLDAKYRAEDEPIRLQRNSIAASCQLRFPERY